MDTITTPDGLTVRVRDRVQCTHPGCIFVAPADAPSYSCIFHGNVEFTHDVTSEWYVSQKDTVFRIIPGGHISIFDLRPHGSFAGLVIAYRDGRFVTRNVIMTHTEIPTLPKDVRPYAYEVFQLTGQVVPKLHLSSPKSSEPQPIDMVKCAACGFHAESIVKHVREEHGYSVSEYRLLYPGNMLISKDLLMKYARSKIGV